MRMAVEDVVVRGVVPDRPIRAFACTTTGVVNALQQVHRSWPVATAALGRTVSVGAMMAMQLKANERLTLQVDGDGPLGRIVVDADAAGHVRGYVQNPHVHLPLNALGKLDVGGAVGRGMLYVMRDMGLRDVYRGSVELQTGEIGDDFTYYFAVSEQTPSAVGAGVLVDTDHSVLAAGGFIVQLMPGHTEEDVAALEARLAGLASVTDQMMAGATAEDLMRRVLPEVRVLERRPLEYRCTCERERIRLVLKSLGRAELESMIREQGGAEVVCHFCNTRYAFTKEELAALMPEEERG
ncbi:Hsp33 family molecular chaperone HslO [Alicyclobacillus sp.]|uniref:Hsp33 family molecular chaperone HslO n=1 Tax=Alicyclobacillus sp. TaxID=61169 RepID=UPI0025C4DC3C|nr:Hsp33 family molecular chaperone HslO [Alicyclobacillus sp.]MCL6517389.1 Hsp33 family molecular chaperone HslO [Alicyclobacillus sp.]